MWQSVNAWQGGIAQLALLTAIVGALLLRFRNADRRSIGLTLGVFAASLAGIFVSGMMASTGFPALGAWLHEIFMILQGVAVIRLGGMFVFRLLLPLVRLQSPRILEDIVVFITYLGWGFVRLHDAGLDLSGIITTSAVITAVIAFSMQDTLGNILGGLALQLDNSIEVGDWIKIEDIIGKVVDIRWRHTAIETRNWETVVVPNSQLMKTKFSVLGRHGEDPVQWRRWIWFNVGYQTSPAHVIETVQRALHDTDIRNVARQPQAHCVLMEFDQSYGRYAVRYWLTDLMADDLTDSEVRDHVYAALQRAGIRLALPEHSVHMTKESEKHEQARQMRRIQERMEALRKVELFNGFTEEELLDIAQRLKYAPFAKGDVITRQGAVAHWLYMLSEGEAEVYLETPGQERRKLSTLHPGNFFGEMGLMTGAPRTATVVAATDAECYLLDKTSFETVLSKRPELAEEISKTLVSRRFGLDSLQQDVDADTRAQQMAQQHQDILARIRHFFGLGQ
ncbi:MAG TPA: mechanosensitive ion channel family protein [Methylophilaceae bacterium]|nr:mechanosensitive ion channel family protein [Methylophilaceae bacterium]